MPFPRLLDRKSKSMEKKNKKFFFKTVLLDIFPRLIVRGQELRLSELEV